MPRVSRPEQTRMKAMRSRWFGSMLAWILKTKPVMRFSCAATRRVSADCARGGGANSASASMRSRTPKFFSAEPKNTGVRCPSRKALSCERPAGVLGERDLLAPASRSSSGSSASTAGLAGPFDRHRRLVGIEPAHEVAGEIVGAGKAAPAPDRPGHRRRVEGERLLDLVEEVERVAALAVHLVDEGDDRDVAQAADLEQLAGARLDALRGVDHHDGGIDRRQRPVGVLGEVLVARRVEEVEDATAVFEGHDRGHDRDAALALDAHPVGAGLARLRFALTSPASWIAPPKSSSFSVSVVLPASGCEMMAKVRRRETGSAGAASAGAVMDCRRWGPAASIARGVAVVERSQSPSPERRPSAKGQIRSRFAASSCAGSRIAFHSASLRCRRPVKPC